MLVRLSVCLHLSLNLYSCFEVDTQIIESDPAGVLESTEVFLFVDVRDSFLEANMWMLAFFVTLEECFAVS